MGISKISYGTGDNLFEISYKDDEVITDSGSNSYISNNFEANTFAAFQSKKLTKFFEAGPNNSYNDATESNCIWRKWDGWNKTDLLSGADVPDGYYTFNSLLTDHNGRRIITELTDIQRVVWIPEVMEDTVNTRINGAAVTVKYYTINTSGNQPLCNIIDATNPSHYTAEGVPIYPWLLSPSNKTKLQVHFNRGDDLTPWGGGCSRYSGVRVYDDNSERYYPVSTAMINYDVPTGNNQNFAFYDDTNSYLMWCSLSTDNFAAGALRCYITSEDELKLYLASCGFKFIYKNRMYKPVAENNVIVGYTDDLASQSDWDKWHTKDDHEKPVTPPAPTPTGDDEDNDDPIPVAGAPYSSGLARYYATTAGSLILSHISEAMGAWNLKDSGKDLYKNIISCKLIKSPAAIPVSGSEPFTVYGVTLQYDGSDITLPVINDNPTASFGPYNIPRKFNDFRDYAPYTKVEIYLPYCGWTVLPSHVVGRSVSVTYYTDIIAATCKAVVYCGANVVAEAAGVIGLDIPMVTENAGAKAEAVTMGLLAYGKAGLQTALGVGAAVATKGKAGVKQAVSGLGDVVSAYSQTAMAFNQNYTEINGKNGDGCCIAGISAIVIKITRPKYGSNTTPPYVPSEYAHSIGYVSMKSAKVSSFTGLLVADNVDTSGISGATDREKQLIKLYLESGIYVNHPS